MKAVKALIDLFLAAVARIDELCEAPGSELKLILFKNDVDPDAATTLDDLEEADFDGYADLTIVPTPTYAREALSQDNLVWFETAAPALFATNSLDGLPQTVYGFAIVNHAKDVLYAAQRLDEPVNLTEAVQAIFIPEIAIRLDEIMGNV